MNTYEQSLEEVGVITHMEGTVGSFFREGDWIFRNAHGLSRVVRKRRFRALFGVSPEVMAETWSLLQSSRPPKSKPKHLLWALLFLKVYATENVNSTLTGADEKTFRKWSWTFVHLISNLNSVSI